jgi:hypothetical protein
MKKLARFSIRADGEETYVLRLEDDAGETLELGCSPEQIDTIIDALDDLLSEHEEEAFEVEEDRARPTPRA